MKPDRSQTLPTVQVLCWIVALAVFISFGPLAHGQRSNRARADIREQRGKTAMIALYNIAGDDSQGCVLRTFTGTIVKVHYDEEFAIRIDGFTLLHAKRERTFFNIEDEFYTEFGLPRSDLSWLPTLLTQNNRVRVDAYLCGAGGNYALANNIVTVRSRKRD